MGDRRPLRGPGFHAPQGFLIRSEEQFGEAVDLDAISAVVGGPGRDNAYAYRRLFRLRP